MVITVFAGAYVAALLLGTLWPLPDTGTGSFAFCIVCGRYGVADAILNVAMFVPLGALAVSRRRPLPLLLGAVLLSAAIELAQLAVPGRDPSLGDFLFNAAGALLGAALPLVWHRIHPRLPHARSAAAVSCAGAAMLVIGLSGWSLRPVVPDGPLWAEWQTTREHLAPYPGIVLAAGVGSLTVRPGPALRAPTIQSLLRRGLYPGAIVTAAPVPDGLAPVLALYDGTDAAIALLGVQERDLVLGIHRRADDLRLHSPALRLEDALAGVAVGDTIALGTRARPDGDVCMAAGRTRQCGIGFDAGSGWRLLVAAPFTGRSAMRLAGAFWLALLAFPVGWFARPKLAVALLAVLLWYAFVRAPLDTELVPVSAAGAAGLVAGCGAGVLAARLRGAARSPAPAAR